METSLSISVDRIDEPRQLFKRPLPRAFLEETLRAVPAYRVSREAEVSAWLTRLSGRDVLLEGKVVVSLESDCRRCLKPVPSETPVLFTLNLVAKPLDAGGKPRKRDDDAGEGAHDASFDDHEADEEPFDGETVELGPIVREQLVLGLPSIEPVCREACKGLCATCGQDLNELDCGHSTKGPDPRWAALKGLKV